MRVLRSARAALRTWTLLAVAAVALAGCQMTGAEPPPTPVVPTPGPTGDGAQTSISGLTVPWAVGHVRTLRDGSKTVDPGEWPDFTPSAIRLWDTRTTWSNLEPHRGEFDFTVLDAHVRKAQANGVDHVTLVLAGTPRWAATKVEESDAPWIGPGSASMPEHVGDWVEFVSTVVRRYAGRIDAYEIGNEPNLRMFWTGTAGEYAKLVRRAARAVRAVDPSATVVVNGGLVRRASDVPKLRRWLRGAVANANVDAVSIHLYPRSSDLAAATPLLEDAVSVIAAQGLGDLPRWLTEVNVVNGTNLPPDAQAKAVIDISEAASAAGFARTYWYSWTSERHTDLIPLDTGTPAAVALAQLSNGPTT